MKSYYQAHQGKIHALFDDIKQSHRLDKFLTRDVMGLCIKPLKDNNIELKLNL